MPKHHRKKNKPSKYLVWIDMEMTGLDPDQDKILEIAVLITDNQLTIIAEGPELVIHHPESVLRKMDAWNRQHHQTSGLLQEVKRSRLSVKKAEQAILRFLKSYTPQGQSPLCGNSIHHDRRFLAKHMPLIHRYLHYRLIDVSTLKELCSRWAISLPSHPSKKEAHRAKTDILESIEELRYYKKYLF
ncbi:MAG: oligoribonuclease [Candidatus Omnitrophica bacterium]|nr:oligoribonuclease [Candidatus Omnitrophota bacterium]